MASSEWRSLALPEPSTAETTVNRGGGSPWPRAEKAEALAQASAANEPGGGSTGAGLEPSTRIVRSGAGEAAGWRDGTSSEDQVVSRAKAVHGLLSVMVVTPRCRLDQPPPQPSSGCS